MLEGYTVLNLTIGLAAMSITQNGVSFNKTAVVKLNYADFVLLMVNTKDKKLAIQICDKQTEGATPFYKKKRGDNNVISVRWNNKDLLNTISKMMGWDLSKQGYKIVGEYLEDEQAMIFDLENAEVLT